MINANAELILQHPGPLITHATQYFLPSHFVISIHNIVDQHAEECHHHDPEHQKLWEPSPVRLNKSVPSFGCHLLIQPHSQRLVALHLQTHQHKIRNLSVSSIASSSSCSPFNHLIPKLGKTSRIHSLAETHIYKLTFLKYWLFSDTLFFPVLKEKGTCKQLLNYHYDIVLRDSKSESISTGTIKQRRKIANSLPSLSLSVKTHFNSRKRGERELKKEGIPSSQRQAWLSKDGEKNKKLKFQSNLSNSLFCLRL